MNIRVETKVLGKWDDTVHYVQGSTEIPIEFDIRDYEIPEGAEARFYLQKPSKKEVYNPCEISGNMVILKPTAQTFSEFGKQRGQLQIVNGEKELVSFIIQFDVEENLIDDSAIQSSNEFGVLDGMINSARNAIAEADAAAGKANTAASAANTAKTNANNAATAANNAASTANTAAGKANTAASAANTAKTNANNAATAANNAAEAANRAAENITGITDLTFPIPIEKGGTGAVNATMARTALNAASANDLHRAMKKNITGESGEITWYVEKNEYGRYRAIGEWSGTVNFKVENKNFYRPENAIIFPVPEDFQGQYEVVGTNMNISVSPDLNMVYVVKESSSELTVWPWLASAANKDVTIFIEIINYNKYQWGEVL